MLAVGFAHAALLLLRNLELQTTALSSNSGWSLVNWTQNGVVVSDDENYSFNVTANRELVAHFALGNRVDAIAEPVNAGTVTGGGVYRKAAMSP